MTMRKHIMTTAVGGEQYSLYYAPNGTWELEAFGGYDGYFRRQYDSLLWAHAEYNDLVQKAYSRRVEEVTA